MRVHLPQWHSRRIERPPHLRISKEGSDYNRRSHPCILNVSRFADQIRRPISRCPLDAVPCIMHVAEWGGYMDPWIDPDPDPAVWLALTANNNIARQPVSNISSPGNFTFDRVSLWTYSLLSDPYFQVISSSCSCGRLLPCKSYIQICTSEDPNDKSCKAIVVNWCLI